MLPAPCPQMGAGRGAGGTLRPGHCSEGPSAAHPRLARRARAGDACQACSKREGVTGVCAWEGKHTYK